MDVELSVQVDSGQDTQAPESSKETPTSGGEESSSGNNSPNTPLAGRRIIKKKMGMEIDETEQDEEGEEEVECEGNGVSATFSILSLTLFHGSR